MNPHESPSREPVRFTIDKHVIECPYHKGQYYIPFSTVCAALMIGRINSSVWDNSYFRDKVQILNSLNVDEAKQDMACLPVDSFCEWASSRRIKPSSLRMQRLRKFLLRFESEIMPMFEVG